MASVTLLEIKRMLAKNEVRDYELYELVACYMADTTPWSLLSTAERQGFYSDQGIDGWNPETRVAVQAKHYLKSKITHRKLATFYAFADRMGAEQKLLISLNRDCLSKGVTDIYFSPEKSLIDFWALSKKRVERFLANLEVPKLSKLESPIFSTDEGEEKKFEDLLIDNEQFDSSAKNLKLRTYQKQAIENFFSSEKEVFRLRMATGLGKSLIIQQIAQYYSKVCIVVPLLSILSDLATYFNPEEIQLVGTGYNNKLDLSKKIILTVENSAYLLLEVDFEVLILDEGHHIYNNARQLKREKTLELSATLKGEVDLDFSLAWGIKQGFLTDYNLELILYRGETHASLVEAVEQRLEWLRILGFCNNLESLSHVVELLKVKNISYGTIIGQTTTEERIRLIKSFQALEIRVLLSVRCLGEGVNIPEASTCIFFDGLSDSSYSLQRMGRVLRTSSVKEKAFIVAPVEVENQSCEEELFKFVKMLSKAEEIEDLFHSGKILMNSWVNRERVKYSSDFEYLGNKIYENLATKWTLKYNLVREFREREGRVPRKKEEKEKKLGSWISTQRKNYKKGILSSERIILLEKLDDWLWFEIRTREQSYLLCLAFVQEYKRRPRSKSGNPEERRLRNWLNGQKQKQKEDKLTDTEIENLKEIDSYCGKIRTRKSEPRMTGETLETTTVLRLREICRQKDLKKYQKLKKPELIDLIRYSELNLSDEIKPTTNEKTRTIELEIQALLEEIEILEEEARAWEEAVENASQQEKTNLISTERVTK